MFNKEQIEQIILGQNEGLDVSIYAKEEIDAADMYIMRMCLDLGIDIKTGLSRFQKIAIRKAFKQKIDIYDYIKPGFGFDKINSLIECIQAGFNIKDVFHYIDEGFSGHQILELEKGKKNNIDYTLYYDKNIPDTDMYIIRIGLEKNINNLINQLSEMQKYVISKAYKDNLFFDDYVKPQFGYREMEIIYDGLKEGLDVTPYAQEKFSYLKMQEILKGIRDGFDISLYANSIFSYSQMHEIRIGLKKHVDVSIYAKPEFDFLQMKEIRKGLEDNLDVSIFAKHEYSSAQMYEIRWGLKEGLDVSVYAKPEFNWQQMKQIYLGLEAELDVSIYAKPELSWEQMEEMRTKLETSLDMS